MAGKTPTEVGGEWRLSGKGPHDDPEVRLGYGLCHVPTMCLMLEGVVFSEFRVTALADGYRVMVKGMRGEDPVVSFYYADTFRDVVMVAVTHLDIGRSTWNHDAYPPK